MEKKNRHPMRIAFPIEAKELENKLIIFLICDEIRRPSQEIINRYRKQKPGSRIKVLAIRGAPFLLLRIIKNSKLRFLMRCLGRYFPREPFSLVIINHERCSGVSHSEEKISSEDFFLIIDMREKLPDLLYELKNLSHLSLYIIETDGKILHLGDYI
ncbi:MAG: hypothetical protein PHX30_06260 [Candidatus Pacebacteria bacterium]|nr:hypothetical protein [Candidatus Paceibacterota bacterium]